MINDYNIFQTMSPAEKACALLDDIIPTDTTDTQVIVRVNATNPKIINIMPQSLLVLNAIANDPSLIATTYPELDQFADDIFDLYDTHVIDTEGYCPHWQISAHDPNDKRLIQLMTNICNNNGVAYLSRTQKPDSVFFWLYAGMPDHQKDYVGPVYLYTT